MARIPVTPLPSDRSHRALAVRFAGRRIRATVTRRASAVRRWIHHTRHHHRRHLHRYRLHRLVVGLGVQWRPASPPHPATLQLCIGRRCLIFQLARSNSIPAALKRFLEDQEIIFVAVKASYDCSLLREEWDLRVGNCVEIRDLAARIMKRRKKSMARMAEEILGLGFDLVMEAKPPVVGTSRWDVFDLSHRQILYACVDAYVSFLLGLMLICVEFLREV